MLHLQVYFVNSPSSVYFSGHNLSYTCYTVVLSQYVYFWDSEAFLGVNDAPKSIVFFSTNTTLLYLAGKSKYEYTQSHCASLSVQSRSAAVIGIAHLTASLPIDHEFTIRRRRRCQ